MTTTPVNWQSLPIELKLEILKQTETLPSCALVSKQWRSLVAETLRRLGIQLANQCPEQQELQQFAPGRAPLTMLRLRELITQLRAEMTDEEYQEISRQYPNPFSVGHIKACFVQVQEYRDTALLALWNHIFPDLQGAPQTQDVAVIRAWMADPQTLPQRQRISAIDLTNLQLRMIPREIQYLTGLQRLDLSNNQIRVIPPEIHHLVALRWLDLSNNQICVIPPEIRHLVALRWLDLSNNQICVIPPELCCLTALNWLVVENNQIRSLPIQFTQLTSLLHLKTRGNPVGDLTAAEARVLVAQTARR